MFRTIGPIAAFLAAHYECAPGVAAVIERLMEGPATAEQIAERLVERGLCHNFDTARKSLKVHLTKARMALEDEVQIGSVREGVFVPTGMKARKYTHTGEAYVLDDDGASKLRTMASAAMQRLAQAAMAASPGGGLH